jgi:hypothetical protein
MYRMLVQRLAGKADELFRRKWSNGLLNVFHRVICDVVEEELYW